MVDLSKTIQAKSDQLNADDLIGNPMTIEITAVKGVEDAAQPIHVNYKGDNGKPWKPCKSMRRVLVFCWGKDGKDYVGKKLTLFCDPKVRFGGIDVGGIRISHMSNIDKPITMALTASKANKKPFTVQPLKKEEQPMQIDVEAFKQEIRRNAMLGTEKYKEYFGGIDQKTKTALTKSIEKDFWATCKELADLADKSINNNNEE